MTMSHVTKVKAMSNLGVYPRVYPHNPFYEQPGGNLASRRVEITRLWPEQLELEQLGGHITVGGYEKIVYLITQSKSDNVTNPL